MTLGMTSPPFVTQTVSPTRTSSLSISSKLWRVARETVDPAIATGPLVVVVGSEGKGLGHLVSQTCDQLVGIPMDGATESLNAGVAASIALYSVATARRSA